MFITFVEQCITSVIFIKIMEATVTKKATAFRLNTDLISRLKMQAKRENRSLSNYVECILFDAVYREPNEETLAAMREVESGVELGTVDMTNLDTFLKSFD